MIREVRSGVHNSRTGRVHGMRQALFLIIALLLFSGVSLGQVAKPEAVQVRRYESGGSGFDEITEANYELTRRLDVS